MAKEKKPSESNDMPQMGLFESAPSRVARPEPTRPARPTASAPPKAPETSTPAVPSPQPAESILRSDKAKSRAKGRKKAPTPARSGGRAVPEGDVRLTANIREDLHLRLKIAAARRRTTIGELIEQWVEENL